MDLVSISQQHKKVSLLSLPKSDLMQQQQQQQQKHDKTTTNINSSSPNGESTKKSSGGSSELVLMQLPKGVTISDLLTSSPTSGGGGCYFVAPRPDTASGNNNNNRQACLVMENKKQSYTVSRLETSNCLVLVPPAPVLNNKDDHNTCPNKGGEQEGEEGVGIGPAARKKPKLSTNNNNTISPPSSSKSSLQLLPVPARLLKSGSLTGSSFLELRPKMLRVGDVNKLLHKHVFNPYNNQTINPYARKKQQQQSAPVANGRSITSLANQLQCSKGQIVETLKELRGFPFPPLHNDNNNQTTSSSLSNVQSNNNDDDDDENYNYNYGVLGEEVMLEAQISLISTLAESDDFQDYATSGVRVEDLIQQALDRLSPSETNNNNDDDDGGYSQQQKEHVLRYALTTLVKGNNCDLPLLLRKNDKSPDQQRDCVQLDVTKIAVWLAHRLFQSQTRPWEENRFCIRWQSELPGVGSAYKVSLDMLRGVAIRVDASSSSPKQQQQRAPRKDYQESEEEGGKKAEEKDQNEDELYCWKYFPASKLPLNAELRFHALFAQREQWSSVELEPYLEGLVHETGLSSAEILLQYTNHSTSPKKGRDGKNLKLYSLKQ